jgi:hypothetical protein
MKKLITVAVVMVSGFFALSAQGRPGVMEIINFDLVCQPQGDSISTNITARSVTTYINKELQGKAFRITSKDVIKLIGAAFGTNFPASSQLAMYGEGEIVIVDATGSNVVFYPNESTPPNSSEWGFYYGSDRGIQWGKGISNSLGDDKEDYTGRSIVRLNLYNYPNVEPSGVAAKASMPVTDSFDLSFSGLITYNYYYVYNHANGNFVQKINGKLIGQGDGYIGDGFGILTGSVSGRGILRGTIARD